MTLTLCWTSSVASANHHFIAKSEDDAARAKAHVSVENNSEPSPIDSEIIGETLKTIVPKSKEYEVYYYPYNKTSGWFLQNSYREERINLKLHECRELKKSPLTYCEKEGIATKNSLWNNKYLIVGAGVVLFVVGYNLGIKNNSEAGKVLRLKRLDSPSMNAMSLSW